MVGTWWVVILSAAKNLLYLPAHIFAEKFMAFYNSIYFQEVSSAPKCVERLNLLKFNKTDAKSPRPGGGSELARHAKGRRFCRLPAAGILHGSALRKCSVAPPPPNARRVLQGTFPSPLESAFLRFERCWEFPSLDDCASPHAKQSDTPRPRRPKKVRHVTPPIGECRLASRV